MRCNERQGTWRCIPFACVVVFSGICVLLPRLVYGAPTCDLIQGLVKEVAEVRGLSPQRAISCTVESKKQVAGFLEQALSERFGDDLIAFEERIFKALRLIPSTFPYKEGLRELYLSQIAGYYDPKRKGYVMAGWLPEEQQIPVAAHELTHALQDQHFNVDALTDPRKISSDVQLARAALIEGDATAVMMDHTMRRLTGSMSGTGFGLELPTSLATMPSLGPVSGLMESLVLNAPELKKAPPALVAMMIFPYSEGLKFVHALLRKGGFPLVSQAFSKLPRSSEEILFPERYLQRQEIDVPEKDSSEKTSAVLGEDSDGVVPQRRDVLGAYVLLLVLRAHALDEADISAIVAAWKSDAVALYPDGTVRWQLAFSEEGAARRMFAHLCAGDKKEKGALSSREKEAAPSVGDSCSYRRSPFHGEITLGEAALAWRITS